jgi:hypothetical protein
MFTENRAAIVLYFDWKMSERKPTIKKKEDKAQIKPHPLLFAFLNAKSAATEIARAIAEDSGQQTPSVVRKFIDEFGRKTC